MITLLLAALISGPQTSTIEERVDKYLDHAATCEKRTLEWIAKKIDAEKARLQILDKSKRPDRSEVNERVQALTKEMNSIRSKKASPRSIINVADIEPGAVGYFLSPLKIFSVRDGDVIVQEGFSKRLFALRGLSENNLTTDTWGDFDKYIFEVQNSESFGTESIPVLIAEEDSDEFMELVQEKFAERPKKGKRARK